MHMKNKYTLFKRGSVYYIQDSQTGKQTSLRTKNANCAKSIVTGGVW